MANRRLEVQISKTINMGNYNSLKVFAGLAEDIPDDIPEDEAYKELWNVVDKEVKRALEAFKTKGK